MKKFLQSFLPFRLAINSIIILNSLVILFHLAIIFRIIPFENVWAGRLKTVDQMLVFETISIVINAILILLGLFKAKRLRLKIPALVLNGLLWLFVVLFLLNTVGNLTATSTLETLIATPLTFLLALLCARVAVEPF